MGKRAARKRPAAVVRRQLAQEQRRRRTLWISLVAVAVLAISAMIGWSVYAVQRQNDYNAPAGTNREDTGIQIGSGPVVIDVYEDFICPACAHFEETTGETLDQLVAQNRAQIVYHPVAFLDRFSSTQYSTRASAASGCAAEAGRFREYAKKLFQEQPPEGGAGLSDTELIGLGASIGLPEDSFGPCVNDGAYRSWTRHVTEEASRAGVTGTPTVLVAGKPVSASPEAILAAVKAAGG